MDNFLRKFAKFFCSIVAILAILVIAICLMPDKSNLLTEKSMGEDYPYNIDNLYLKCEPLDAVWVETAEGEIYALNGFAINKFSKDKKYKGTTNLILKPNKGDVDLLKRGLEICKNKNLNNDKQTSLNKSSNQESLTEEQIQKRNEAKQYVTEKANKIFAKITKENDGFNYEFFISPDVWNSVNFEEKQQIFELAVLYIKSENPALTDVKCKVKTKIKNNMTGELFAEYTIKGLKIY